MDVERLKFDMVTRSRQVVAKRDGAEYVVVRALTDWSESHDGGADADSYEEYIEDAYLDVEDFVEQPDGSMVWYSISSGIGTFVESVSTVCEVV